MCSDGQENQQECLRRLRRQKYLVPIEKLKEWEDGTNQPTIRQAETLAKAYRRPFALFFLPEIPRDFQPLQDYRRKSAKTLGTASIFIIREIQQKQAWIRDVYEDNHQSKLPFVGKYSLRDNPKKLLKIFSTTLEIHPLRVFFRKSYKRMDRQS